MNDDPIREPIFNDKTTGEPIVIGESTDSNTLNGKRYLKGTLKIWSEETKNFTDDGDTLYFLITSVYEKTPKFHVSVQRISSKNPEKVKLSSKVRNIILQPDSDVGTDTSKYKIIQGFLPNNVDDKLQLVTSVTSVDLQDIPNGYIRLDTY